MGNLIDAAKVLVSPLEKLIDAVRSAIGIAYKPRNIRKLTDAKVYEIDKIGQALRENSDIPIIYDKGIISIDTTDFDAFTKRTQSRLAFQELTKQRNIESVIDVAYSELENQDAVTNEPIDPDWIIRFFNSVEDISNEQMQRIWGKLLAGEIKHPGTFSLRTLNILKALTQSEAIIFKDIIPFVLRCKGDRKGSFDDYFILNGKDDFLEEKYEIPFVNILKLSEAGLISDNIQIHFSFEVESGKTELIRGTSKAIEIKNMADTLLVVQHSAYFLTETGKELFPIIVENNYTENINKYMADCLEEIKNHGFRLQDESTGTARISIKLIEY